MLKMLGAVLVIGAFTLYGFYRAGLYAKRPVHIRQMIHALQMLETEITYGFTQLPEALQRISRQTGEPLAAIFLEAAQRMSESGTGAEVSWREAALTHWGRTAMNQAERDAVLRLAPTLGVTDRDNQVKHLRLAASELATQESSAREEQGRYERMWRTLGVLAGALVVILMY